MFGLPATRARPQPCTGPAGEDRRVYRHGPSWSDLAPRASMRVLGIRVGVRPVRPGPYAGKNALVRRLRPQLDSRSNWRRTVSKEAITSISSSATARARLRSVASSASRYPINRPADREAAHSRRASIDRKGAPLLSSFRLDLSELAARWSPGKTR